MPYFYEVIGGPPELGLVIVHREGRWRRFDARKRWQGDYGSLQEVLEAMQKDVDAEFGQ